MVYAAWVKSFTRPHLTLLVAHGLEFFSILHSEIHRRIRHCQGWEYFPYVPIAWLELCSAFLALHTVAHRYPIRLLLLYLVSSNAVSLLGSNDPHSPSSVILSLQLRIKYRFTKIFVTAYLLRRIPQRRLATQLLLREIGALPVNEEQSSINQLQ